MIRWYTIKIRFQSESQRSPEFRERYEAAIERVRGLWAPEPIVNQGVETILYIVEASHYGKH